MQKKKSWKCINLNSMLYKHANNITTFTTHRKLTYRIVTDIIIQT